MRLGRVDFPLGMNGQLLRRGMKKSPAAVTGTATCASVLIGIALARIRIGFACQLS